MGYKLLSHFLSSNSEKITLSLCHYYKISQDELLETFYPFVIYSLPLCHIFRFFFSKFWVMVVGIDHSNLDEFICAFGPK